jgi:hypothetical protein
VIGMTLALVRTGAHRVAEMIASVSSKRAAAGGSQEWKKSWRDACESARVLRDGGWNSPSM